MAQDLHGDTILHSLYGRKLGIDPNGFLTGHPDNKYGTERITSTSPSTLAAGGTSILQATGAAAYELVSPSAMMLGVRKRLIHNSTGAAQAQLVKLTAGNFMSALGSSMTTLSLTTRGAAIDIEYISTALVAVIGLNSTSTSGFVQMSTST